MERCYARLLRVTIHNYPQTRTLRGVIPLQGPGEDGQEVTMGRHRDNRHQLDSPKLPKVLSKHHCKIVIINGEHHIVDNGSTNGTFVNGSRIPSNEPVKLTNGDVVSMGGPAAVVQGEESVDNLFRYVFQRVITRERWVELGTAIGDISNCLEKI